jgi:hypothetical protein
MRGMSMNATQSFGKARSMMRARVIAGYGPLDASSSRYLRARRMENRRGASTRRWF